MSWLQFIAARLCNVFEFSIGLIFVASGLFFLWLFYFDDMSNFLLLFVAAGFGFGFMAISVSIKGMSGFMPVILVTHNSTVGASIKPDYLVYTSKRVNDGKVEYDLYTGYPTDKVLVGLDGMETDNHKVLLDCLEAGREPYAVRRKEYEVLEDR